MPPIGSTKTTATNSSKAAPSSSSGPGGGGRTTFRPPWVKADATETKPKTNKTDSTEAKPKTTIKTTAPWAKKATTTDESAKDAVKKNGETSKTVPATNKTGKITPVGIAAKAVVDSTPRKEAKLQSREIKVPILTEKRKAVQEPLVKPKPKKPPTPPESEEEETESETESESESESEDTPPPKKAETELELKFQAEKPKLRPVVVKRDKSLSSTQKKREDDDDDEAEEGETEEDRERRRRFKLERPKLRHVVMNTQKSINNKSTDDFEKIRPVLKKVQKVDEVLKEPPSEPKPEFKDKVLKKVIPIKKDPTKSNVVFDSTESESETDETSATESDSSARENTKFTSPVLHKLPAKVPAVKVLKYSKSSESESETEDTSKSESKTSGETESGDESDSVCSGAKRTISPVFDQFSEKVPAANGVDCHSVISEESESGDTGKSNSFTDDASESESDSSGTDDRKTVFPVSHTTQAKVPAVKVPAPPPLPSLVPKPPPPPPPPLAPPTDFEKKNLTENQKATLEKLKTRPRRRPDWSEMMKEVEDGKKLRHVQCNDRSQPIITCKSMTKVDDKFVYETEKDNAHNKLLQQIQGGIRLKPVKTNDRSKPFLDGLRKFRRQMTIEEQIQKSESKAALNQVPQEPDEPSGDELDDIDKLRDDLQSTKQMLALELRNREAQERENKRLLAKIANLEAELQRDKTRTEQESSSTPSAGADDGLVQSLKKDAEEARKTSKELEKKYEKSAEQLDATKNEVEEQKRMIAQLEKKLSQALQQSPVSNNIKPQFRFCYSLEDPSDTDIYYNFQSDNDYQLAQPSETNNANHVVSSHITNYMNLLKGGQLNGSRRASEANPNKESSPELELELSESEEDEDEEKKAERRKRRLTKEVKILQTKLTKLKDKQEAAKRDRANLKQLMKKNHVQLKEENKKFKKLEKEVQKMAASMKEEADDDDEQKDEDEEGEEEEQEAEQESEEETEEETESEESEEESESETESEDEPEDASDENKKENLEPRVKKHENRLSALKKGNVLLQANVDNLQDEISKVREKASSLQSELDAVLADLGL